MEASPSLLSELQGACLAEARARLRTRFDLRRVPVDGGHYVEAWSLPVDLGFSPGVTLKVPPRFPFELPHVYLDGSSQFGTLCHVNRHNRFCYVDDSAIAFSVDRIADAVEEAVDKCLGALRNPASLMMEDEFRKELFAYLPASDCFYSLLKDLETPRRVSALMFEKETYGKASFILADTEEEGRAWVSNTGLGKVAEVEEVTFLASALPGKPPFPMTVGEILSHLRSDAPELVSPFLGGIRGNPRFVAAVQSSLGPSLVSWKHAESPFKDRRAAPRMPGFRQGRYPVSLELEVRAGERVSFLRGERIDLERLARRTDPGLGGGRLERLVVVGAGAVGSHATEMLCDAVACESVTVFDDDVLKPENVLRHARDWTDVGFSKSFLTTFYAGRKHPNIVAEARKSALAEFGLFEKAVASASTLVLATGSEAVDRFLAESALRVGREGLVIAQLWVEADAERGHVLRVEKRAGTCETLVAKQRATLDKGDLGKEPGCGGAFANYGGSRLQRYLAVAVDRVLNSIGSVAVTWTARAERDNGSADAVVVRELVGEAL